MIVIVSESYRRITYENYFLTSLNYCKHIQFRVYGNWLKMIFKQVRLDLSKRISEWP